MSWKKLLTRARIIIYKIYERRDGKARQVVQCYLFWPTPPSCFSHTLSILYIQAPATELCFLVDHLFYVYPRSFSCFNKMLCLQSYIRRRFAVNDRPRRRVWQHRRPERQWWFIAALPACVAAQTTFLWRPYHGVAHAWRTTWPTLTLRHIGVSKDAPICRTGVIHHRCLIGSPLDCNPHIPNWKLFAGP